MKKPPSPSRLRLDTSPPEGVEDGRPSSPPHCGGKVVRRTGEGVPQQESRKAELTSRARLLRKDGTKAEALLWMELKAKRLGGYHFVRQLPIGNYIADFACRTQRLVVEVD